MKFLTITLICILSITILISTSFAQQKEPVKIVKSATEKKINVFIGNKFFTSFLYPDSLEKPVLYPVTKEKKHLYGWIKTDKSVETSGGKKGIISYHANWTNQQNDVLLEEKTRLEFSGTEHLRIIDRTTVLTADTTVNFTDAKDGLYGIRLAHALQIPSIKDEKFKDDKGNVTIVTGVKDKIANGNYITSEGKQGDDAWSTRGRWCKVYGKMGNDFISIAIIDHPENPNYPTFWHARGYGLFAANPLGEKIFTKGKSSKNLQLQKGESVTFRFRIVIEDGNKTLTAEKLNRLADEFRKYR